MSDRRVGKRKAKAECSDAEWNARIDLTAARSDEELVDLMLADALILAARVPAGA